MGVRVRDSAGTLRTVSRIKVRDDGGVSRTIQRIRIRDAAGTLRTVWQFFSAAATPTLSVVTLSGNAPSGEVNSELFTCTVSGGTGPFTYSWSRISGAVTMAPLTATASTTVITDSDVEDGTTVSAIFKCTVTDTATGSTTETNEVTSYLSWVDTSGA